jgi:hypothetical protein
MASVAAGVGVAAGAQAVTIIEAIISSPSRRSSFCERFIDELSS